MDSDSCEMKLQNDWWKYKEKVREKTSKVFLISEVFVEINDRMKI